MKGLSVLKLSVYICVHRLPTYSAILNNVRPLAVINLQFVPGYVQIKIQGCANLILKGVVALHMGIYSTVTVRMSHFSDD